MAGLYVGNVSPDESRTLLLRSRREEPRSNGTERCRDHDAASAELPNAALLLHSTGHARRGADNSSGLHHRPEDHEAAVEGEQ